MPLIGNYASNATVNVFWLLALLVFTAPEGTPVGIMTEQLETVSRATHDAPPGSHTVFKIHDASQSSEQPPPQPMLPQ